MNVELLGKIKDLILAEPEKLNMDHWTPVERCGTACCIAGWACVLGGVTRTRAIYTADTARELLGLNFEDSQRLFFPDGWPKQFTPEEDDFEYNVITAEQAANRIDHFIATEGRE